MLHEKWLKGLDDTVDENVSSFGVRCGGRGLQFLGFCLCIPKARLGVLIIKSHTTLWKLLLLQLQRLYS